MSGARRTNSLLQHDFDAAADPGFDRWRAMAAATGGCREPIHLFGESRMIHAGTGEVLSSYSSENEPVVVCGQSVGGQSG
jgi:hypothetical protein